MKMTHHVLNNNYCLRTIHLPFGGFNMDFIFIYLFIYGDYKNHMRVVIAASG